MKKLMMQFDNAIDNDDDDNDNGFLNERNQTRYLQAPTELDETAPRFPRPGLAGWLAWCDRCCVYSSNA